ncbi:PEP-CTERM sorting domain-containing protein [Salinisphaera sp.]|uniref:PEP-CTERM sorting domain-containing protein n=1 Tax=Salinisphaera sp. TaxID=1914330 RepID=UPI002D78FAED|nr:PEP-CTERM sorting domain-containing protein [Salinisphaera sp.]HET7313008.1 PEP-CTERM sorting domain-containing protein [Salinisphaera sp.]
MKKMFYSSAAVVAALAFAGPAFASQIDVNTNVNNGEPSLYEIANTPSNGNGALFADLDANSPQVNNAHWTGGANGSSNSVLQATWTANYDNATFGVYSIYDTSIKLNLLYGGSAIGANSDMNTKGFLSYLGNGNFMAYTQDVSNPVDVTNVQTENFGSSIFGYFLTIGGNTYYSDSDLNGGEDRMVGYQGDNSGTLLMNEYLFGWEDGTDNDYQDYVATVESVRPVPEPSSIAMLGIGLLMIGFAARRLQKRDI